MTSTKVLDASRFVSLLPKASERASFAGKKTFWHLSLPTRGTSTEIRMET